MPPHADADAIEVASLTGIPLTDAKRLLSRTNGSVTNAVNSFFDSSLEPEARLSDAGGSEEVTFHDTDGLREDLNAMSIKELKKFIKDADWSIAGKNITEKADLVDLALSVCTATGRKPPRRRPPPPQPRLVSFEDEEEKAPAAALRAYCAGGQYIAPPVSPKRASSAMLPLKERVLQVLKQASDPSELQSVLAASCIPHGRGSTDKVEACQRLGDCFAECADQRWGDMRANLQEVVAQAVAALQRSATEDRDAAAASGASNLQTRKEQEVAQLGSRQLPPDDMIALTEQVSATRALSGLTLDHLKKLSKSRPQGVQATAISEAQSVLASHQAIIATNVQSDREAKAAAFSELRDVLSRRDAAVLQIGEHEQRLRDNLAGCSTEAQVPELLVVERQLGEALEERCQVMAAAREETARLNALYETHSVAMHNWEVVEAAAAEAAQVLSALLHEAEAFVEDSVHRCQEEEASTEAKLAQSLQSGAELQHAMVEVLHKKRAHIMATRASTQLVLSAEAPQNDAMHSVLDALAQEQRLLEARLADIGSAVVVDQQMLAELEARGSNLQLSRVAEALAGVLDGSRKGVDTSLTAQQVESLGSEADTAAQGSVDTTAVVC